MMSKLAAHHDVPLVHYFHAASRITCNPAQPTCYLGECNYCPAIENVKVQLAQYFEEAEIEAVEFTQWTTKIDQLGNQGVGS